MTKYRGFRKDGKGWVEGYYWKTKSGHYITHNGATEYQDVFIHPESLGISVGLSDKNGREIFGSIDGSKGGDVLMYIGTNMSSMDVIFQNGMFVGVGPFNTHSLHTYLTASDFQSIEIIGNQYEPQQP